MKAGLHFETQFNLFEKPIFGESTFVEQNSHVLCPGVYRLVYLMELLKGWHVGFIILEVLNTNNVKLSSKVHFVSLCFLSVTSKRLCSTYIT